MIGLQMNEKWKEFGRIPSWLIWINILECGWRDWGKLQKRHSQSLVCWHIFELSISWILLENLSDVLLWYYRPVLTDLARILTLLNRPEHLLISPPSDWEKLLAWGERVLRRYKKQNPHQVCRICVTGMKIIPTQSTHLLSNCCNVTWNLN
jgi:hypothetical protein